ncbi:hypothetical protein FOA43_000999 [Brettanomyces nanus]|uniref:Uncharacterized protein n=1 Tax=Eeniella nana TaxID=13502 RepID=A0A875RXB8_EENNA|nr:uncharacterized protein FOA43_000999 [Brettanomyces nanus]QPG73686.1 hypothetical protein FOA43_000999 [Brettanomyces nanus]
MATGSKKTVIKPKKVIPNKQKTRKKVALSKAKSSSSLRSLNQKKRKVFKPILSNPYTRRNEWPHIEPKIMRSILDLLVDRVLSDTGKYNQLSKEEKKLDLTVVPEEADYISYGFNSTMKLLENQIKQRRQGKLNLSNPDTVSYVFVCKLDMTSNLLYLHFPIMSSIAKVKLIQLPKGSNLKLKNALGIKQTVEILVLKKGLVDKYPILSRLVEDNVSDVNVGFLDNDTLGLDVRFLLVDQPVGKKRKKKNE